MTKEIVIERAEPEEQADVETVINEWRDKRYRNPDGSLTNKPGPGTAIELVSYDKRAGKYLPLQHTLIISADDDPGASEDLRNALKEKFDNHH